MNQRVIIWDEISTINGVSAEEVFANRPDLSAAKGDIFLVVDAYNRVNEIQIGSIIASNYNMASGLSLQQIADNYMIKKQEEVEAAEIEQLTNEELQEQVALLSYEVMELQGENAAMALAEGEYSPKFNMIRIWFNKGFWNETMVQKAVELGQLTEEEQAEILA